jgi:PAS domain S-box-containing protein
MNAIGNDNYRPGLSPPEPVRHSGGWLSSNMAQLMVFLNGLILTITAFATLSVFIDEIIQEGLFNTTVEIQDYIVESYYEAESSLTSLSNVIELSNSMGMSYDNAENGFKDFVVARNSSINYFDKIILIEKNESGEWDFHSLLTDEPPAQEFGTEERLLGFVQAQITDGKQEVYVSSPVPVNPVSITSALFSIEGQNFAFIKPHIKYNKIIGYVVGFTNLNKIIETSRLERKEFVYTVQVIDTNIDMPIYTYQRPERNMVKPSSLFMNIFSNNFLGKDIDVKVELGIGSREAFLQKIPLLMLLFGITLTLIGTLYVRNNQSQSRKLAEMNKELAHKNFELNQEMSERERLNQVIQKSAREHRAIINSVSDIIFEAGIDGKLLFLNDAWNTVTGFELERSIGRNLFDLLYVQDQDEQKENFEALVKGKKQSYRAFTRLRSSDGSFRAIELAVSMLRQDENNEMRVVGTITDVEERRRAERALSEAEKKYRAIVENAAGGIYQVTPEGQFLSANPAFAKITGYDTPEEVLRDISNAMEELYLDAQARAKFLAQVSSLGMSQTFETQIRRKDGRIIWVSESVRPVTDDEGTLLFYEGSMDDVDQRRKAEIALKDAKTESDLANRAKSEFLANMSHELRTPLNAVIGFAEIIKNEAFGPLPKREYKEYAKSIYESGQNLLKVINEILDVSRIDAGERTLNEGVVNIVDVVQSALSLMDTKIKSNQIRVENKVRDTAMNFIGEKQAVKQMLLNLMSNAVKFSPPNSLMMVDAELDSKGRLRLSVTDTGKGLDEHEVEKALSPFGQLETEHSRTKSGTGLGLTLVKSLVELHGGELELVSQKGIGTTATLIFPAQRVAQNKKSDKSESSEDNLAEEYPEADVF